MNFIVFALLFIGFAGLSLTMNRHYLQLTAKNSGPRSKQFMMAIRAAAYGFLVAGLVFCINSQGVSIGLVFWVGLLTLAALLQAMLLSYRPHWVLGCGLMLITIGTSHIVYQAFKESF